MILAIIVIVFCFIVFILSFDEEMGFKTFLFLTTIVGAFAFYYFHEPSEEKRIEIFEEKIYSLNDGGKNINGSFLLGSGSISSQPQYSYFIKNENGSKEKKFIPSNKTEIFEGDYEPKFVKETCYSAKKYSLFYGFRITSDKPEDNCQGGDTFGFSSIHRKLFVPKDTIILEFQLK